MRLLLSAIGLAASLLFIPGAHASDMVLDDDDVQRAAILAADMSASLANLCDAGTEAQMLDVIGDRTRGVKLEIAAAALSTLANNRALCPAAHSAAVAAHQSAQLALGDGAAEPTPNGRPAANEPIVGFYMGGVGAPGGGGGSGYQRD
jgi:hypothetical protein